MTHSTASRNVLGIVFFPWWLDITGSIWGGVFFLERTINAIEYDFKLLMFEIHKICGEDSIITILSRPDLSVRAVNLQVLRTEYARLQVEVASLCG